MQEAKFKEGDLIVHDDVLAIVERVSYSESAGEHIYSLVSKSDPEMSTSAIESRCEAYDPESFDEDAEKQRLSDARFSSAMTMQMVDGITDKHYRDGNH